MVLSEGWGFFLEWSLSVICHQNLQRTLSLIVRMKKIEVGVNQFVWYASHTTSIKSIWLRIWPIEWFFVASRSIKVCYLIFRKVSYLFIHLSGIEGLIGQQDLNLEPSFNCTRHAPPPTAMQRTIYRGIIRFDVWVPARPLTVRSLIAEQAQQNTILLMKQPLSRTVFARYRPGSLSTHFTWASLSLSFEGP